MLKITYDPSKRDKTLLERGIDFEDAAEVLEGTVFEQEDDRQDYGETRIRTIGYLRGRMVVVVWTQRGTAYHVISMRKANDREQRDYRELLGGP